MNRNLLKWILIAAVIIGAAGYLILSGTSSNHKKGEIVVGHSKAFKIEPLEGITISAEENALDKNRKFKLTAVDDKVYDKVVEQLDGSDVRPLMVFELDAGLKPEDRLPGDYEVTMDLDGMGIPRCLHDNVAILRGVGSDKKLAFSEYNTHVKDGKLTFRSNRNSKLILGLRHRPEFVLTSAFHMFFKSPVTYFQEACASWWSGAIETIHMYFYDPTYTTILVEHESGNFRLHFLFRDTEGNGRYLAYRANNWAFENRINELEKEAHRLWEAKVQKQVEKELGEYKEFCFFKWAFSKKQVDAIKAGINEEAILDSLVSIDVKNGELARIQADPNGKLPESIENIINQIIRANQYLDTISLHKLNFFIDVFLVDDWAFKHHGAAKTYFFYDGYMFLNYPNYFKPGPDKTQVTFVHELGHLRQQGYYGMKASSEAQEATIVVLERDAARQWHKDGFFKADPESLTTVSNLMTPRSTYQMFGIPLDKTNCPDEGYTMGDAIEGIREGVGKEGMDMSYFIYSFIGHGPHKNGWTGWIKWALDIDDEQLNKGWHHFGATRLYYIFDCLTHSGGESPTAKEAATVHLDLTPSSPVAHLKKLRKPRDYAVSTFWIHLPDKPKGVTEEAANVFVYCEDPGADPYVSFYWSDWEFREYLKNKGQDVYLLKPEPSLFYAGNRETDYVKDENGNIKIRLQDGKRRTNNKSGGYQLAAVTSSQSKGPWHNYYVVALFKPEAQKINKVDDDVITFRVPKPNKDLRKKGLVVGAEYTYTDKDGHTETFNVSPDQFGEKVNWHVANCGRSGNEFSISFHWFYQQDDNTICVSPESEKTMFNVGEKKENKEKKKKEEPIVIDEKEGYWKQVGSNVKVLNTTDDTDPGDNSDATKDLRSLQMLREGDQELEFIGIATTEVKKDGKIHYEKEFYLDGYVNYTEPPKQWPARTNYTCEWYTDKDPFLLKMKKPFTFEVENTTSAPKACDKGKDKVTEKKSKTADGKWLNQVKTVFKTNKPKKDDPRAFTIEQKYTVSTFAGSNKKVSVVLTYNYEWVEGEMEPEPEVKKESAPKGGCWKLVRTIVDDSNASGKSSDPSLQEGGYIKGEKGKYTAHGERIDKEFPFSYDRVIRFETPKTIYQPGEIIELEIHNEAFTVRGNGTPDKFPYGKILIYDQSRAAQTGRHFYDENPRYENGAIVWKYGNAEVPQPGYDTKTGDPGFYIQEEVESQYCTKKTIYYYEWVEDGKTAESVKDEPSQEDQENFLDITEIQFYCHTNEPYGKGVVYTTYDHQGVSYKFKKTGSSSTFNGRHYDSEDVFTTTRSGDYQIVTAKFRQNKFDGSKANVDGYRSGGDKTCVDEEFTLTLKIAKDRSVEGTFSGTRKTLAGAGSWPEVASTCNMSISGSFGPEKIKDNDYSHDFTTINSFSYSVGGFQAYFKRADGTMPTNVDNTREFKFSTTSTNARICLSIFGTK